MKFSLTGKIVLAVVCFGIALVGFMIKLPAVFRHHDTELHTIFYFFAAGFLNILFVKRSLAGHVLVFALLYLMGVAIEYAQEYSNSLVRQRIHGRYDAEDVEANVKGLVYFSVLWAGYVLMWHATRPMRSKKPGIGDPVSAPSPVVADVVGAPRQTEASGHSFTDPQDEEKLLLAIQLLTEVVNRNPGHGLSVQLRVIINDLKKKYR